jgi:hypothetical protein
MIPVCKGQRVQTGVYRFIRTEGMDWKKYCGKIYTGISEFDK